MWFMSRQASLRLVVLSSLLVVLSGLTPAGASSANLSHSYASQQPIPDGSLVSLDASRSNYVEASNTSNGEHLLGVAVASDDSLLAVDAANGKVQVATSGTVSALVSTLNGPVGVGDEIGVSPFSGIGTKAPPGVHIIGLAQTALQADSSGSRSQTVTDKAGNRKQVTIGYVRLNIGIGLSSAQAAAEKLTSLQRLGKSVTGRTIPTIRLVVSVIVAVISLAIIVTLLYASIYSGIVSVGRNPLAKYAIFRSLIGVISMALALAVVSITVIVFLLR